MGIFLEVGFYLVKDNQLVLGPFQGPIAYCTGSISAKVFVVRAGKKPGLFLFPMLNSSPITLHVVPIRSLKLFFLHSKTKKVALVLDVDSDSE